MIRKQTVSLILAAALMLALVLGLPFTSLDRHGSTSVDPQSNVILVADNPTPTPSGSGVSGGGNTGG